MTVTLRRVLRAFEEAESSLRFDELCRALEIEPGTLDSMIQHWVRRGRIREVGDEAEAEGCPACGVRGECPLVMHMPRRYELVP